jgi:hypothetical protein
MNRVNQRMELKSMRSSALARIDLRCLMILLQALPSTWAACAPIA